MRRPGVISWGMLHGQPDLLKHYIMLYDEIWVPFLGESTPTEEIIAEWELDRSHLADLAYLQEVGFLREPPLDLTGQDVPHDEVSAALLKFADDESSVGDQTFKTAEEAALRTGEAEFNIDIALTRLTCHRLWQLKQESAYPIAFPFVERDLLPEHLSRTQDVLSVVVKQFPVPSTTLPLEDILAFKRDPETTYKFAKVWNWISETTQQPVDTRVLAERIEWGLTEYSKQLQLLTKSVHLDAVEVLVTTPLELLEDLVKIRWSKPIRRAFDVRRKQIAAHRELKLPGSELAYIAEAARLLADRVS